MGQTLASDQPRAAYEAYGCMVTGDCGTRVYWVPRMSSPIQRVNELGNQSRVPGGLRDPQIVRRLLSQIEGRRNGVGQFKSIPYFDLENQTISRRKRNHGARWTAHDVQMGSGRTNMSGELYTISNPLLLLDHFLSLAMIPILYDVHSDLCKCKTYM